MTNFRGNSRQLSLIALVAFCLTPYAHAADECPTIRLDQGSGCMANIPVKDQQETSICNSYAAATVLDAWAATRFGASDRPRFSSSPLYLATVSKISTKKPLSCPQIETQGKLEPLFQGGGGICAAFDAATRFGSCSEEALDSFLKNQRPQPERVRMVREAIKDAERRALVNQRAFENFGAKRATYKNKGKYEELHRAMKDDVTRDQEKLRDLRREEQNLLDKPATSDLAAIRTLYSDEWIQPHCLPEPANSKSSCKLSGSASPGSTPTNDLAAEVIDKTARLTLQSFKKQMDDAACAKNHWEIPKTSCKPSCNFHQRKQFSDPNKGFQTRITETLSAPRALPIPAAICSAAVRPASQHRVWEEVEKIRPPKGDSWLGHPKCGLHAVLIIGQEKNATSGKCQYRVRNSWGTDCSNVCNDQQCRCGPNGDVLVNRDYFLRNTAEISVVSDGSCK